MLKVKFWGVRGYVPTPASTDEMLDKIRAAVEGQEIRIRPKRSKG